MSGCFHRSQMSGLSLRGLVLLAAVLCGTDLLIAADAKPATVAEAVKAIDFSRFPLLKGAQEPGTRTVGQLSYLVNSNCKAAYEFQRQTLTGLKWTELPGTMITDQYASGAFTHSGFTLSVSTSPTGDPKQPAQINVMLALHGNVDLKKLPMPTGLKVVYVGPQVAMYSTDASVAKTVEQCHKKLRDAGWLPYGKAGDTQYFRQNAIRLLATISAAPAQGGKTSVSFATEQLSAEIPAPTETVQLQYADTTRQVLFDTKDTPENILAYYRKTLGATHWQATTENTIRIDFKDVLIFRNPAKDLLTLELYPVKDEQVLRVTAKFETAAEVAAMEKRLNEQAAAAKKKAEMEKNKPLPKVSLTVPSGATLTEETKTGWELTAETGKAKTAVAALRKQLTAAGWTEKVTLDNGMIGEITFSKDNNEISLSYVDPGLIPAEITIRSARVQIQKDEPKN